MQNAHTAIANLRAKLPERLARWVLMAQDHVSGDNLVLTHALLEGCWGLRAGVTEALHGLRKRPLHSGPARRDRGARRRRAGERVAGALMICQLKYRRLIGEQLTERAKLAYYDMLE